MSPLWETSAAIGEKKHSMWPNLFSWVELFQWKIAEEIMTASGIVFSWKQHRSCPIYWSTNARYNCHIVQMINGASLLLQTIWQARKGQVRHTHRGIIAGKLNGHIPAQTPSGSRMLKVSIPLETFDTYSPICSVPIPHACSTTSTWLGVQNQSGTINGQHKKEFYHRKGRQFKHMKRAFWTTTTKSAVILAFHAI